MGGQEPNFPKGQSASTDEPVTFTNLLPTGEPLLEKVDSKI